MQLDHMSLLSREHRLTGAHKGRGIMYIRSRVVRVVAAAALAAGGLTAAISTPATAATSCYGSAKSITATNSDGRWPVSGYAYATSYCNDINVKSTKFDYV